MVGVHVCQLTVYQHHDLILALLLLLPDVGSDDPLSLLFQQRITVHLSRELELIKLPQFSLNNKQKKSATILITM